MDTTKRTLEDYAIAWIFPLRFEQIAALAMLDVQHEYLSQAEDDDNLYLFGSVKGHNIVIASLLEMPQSTTGSAARVVDRLTYTFPALRVLLLIGVGGGTPSETEEGPIRLGQVAVSKDIAGRSGVYRYLPPPEMFRHKVVIKPSPEILARATERFAVVRNLAETDPITHNLHRITSKPRLRTYDHPGAQYDRLYYTRYRHVDENRLCGDCCDDMALASARQQGEVDIEGDREVTVHQGIIAVGDWDTEMKDAEMRDKLAEERNILCFDKEAFGLAISTLALIIRGIVDYADSHANDKWHKYGAAVAAAYAREVILRMTTEDITGCEVWQRF